MKFLSTTILATAAATTAFAQELPSGRKRLVRRRSGGTGSTAF